jgi:diacylglycerol kinase family enzyme
LKRARSITADGELIGRTPAEFHLLPKALSVFVPEAQKVVLSQ